MRAGKDYAKLMGGDTTFQLLTLIRFGRFDDVSDIIAPAEGDIPTGVWEFAYGYASLRTGQNDAASAHLASMRKLAETSVAIFPSSVRHPARRVLGLLSGILEGEIARVSGDLPSAITAFERAVRLDDELEVDEPEPLPFPARHWLGAALLEARRPLDAERVYREDLRQHPHNGWALVGLQLALRAQGKSTVDVDEDLRSSWSRSDTWIQSSRF
jgi:tetratricopeptide (TPR) repeat protein